MDLFEAIQKRHSYRGPYHDNAVPRGDLERIVTAGIQAPSGKNAQTTRFVIVDDPELVARIGKLHASNVAVQQARAFIACVIDQQPDAVYEGHSFQIEDCAAAVENMLLAITALGYASVWIDGWLRAAGRATQIGDWLGVPSSKVIRVILPIGRPVETWPQKEKLPLPRRTSVNRYGEE